MDYVIVEIFHPKNTSMSLILSCSSLSIGYEQMSIVFKYNTWFSIYFNSNKTFIYILMNKEIHRMLQPKNHFKHLCSIHFHLFRFDMNYSQ
jgi:hypothetical protein